MYTAAAAGQPGAVTHGARPSQPGTTQPGTTPPGSTAPATGHVTGGPAHGAQAATGGGHGTRPGAGPSRSGTGPHC
jgi:hypothetical protein